MSLEALFADTALLGATAGLLLSLFEAALLLTLAARIRSNVKSPSAPTTARVLTLAAFAGIPVAVLLGYVIGASLR